MIPVNVCLAGDAASAATTRRLKMRCFIFSRYTESARPLNEIGLAVARRTTTVLKFRWLGTAPSDLGRGQVEGSRPSIPTNAFYAPGVMRWAVDVPASMIHTVPALLLSGSPSDCVVAPGTA